MKRILCLLMVLFMLSALVACGGDTKDTETDGIDTVDTSGDTDTSGSDVSDTDNIDENKPMTLYNGIELPADWPPDNIEATVGGSSGEIPYLISKADGGTRPDVIDISVGRQLFVDDFLIESTTLTSTAHKAEDYSDSPIIVPDLETDNNICILSSSGVWYDEEEEIFKMWYIANWTNGGIAYATSKDGIHWEKPMVGAGSNIVYKQLSVDSCAVWMNKEAENPNEKYVLFVRSGDTKYKDYENPKGLNPGYIYTSPDGIRWTFKTQTGVCGDRSTIFYNPFTKQWNFSMRSSFVNGNKKERSRMLSIVGSLANFKNSWERAVEWMFADKDDVTNEYFDVAQIYCVDAVAYESVMLSMVEILAGPDNSQAESLGIPKVTELTLGFSRDGFHFDRSNKEPIIRSSRDPNRWDQGYISPAAGVCVTVGDKLYFYYSGWQAINGKPAGKCCIGLATMRRDGFVSMDGTGELTTRTMCAEDGRKYLFINAKGSVKAEILDENGKVYDGYSVNDCVGFSGDSTCTKLSWRSGDDLSFLEGKNFKIRFYTENAELYAFWLSDTVDGESHGYHGAGLVE